jgi:acetate kinase
MHILVLNPGSSSIKFSLYDSAPSEPHPLYDGELSGIGAETRLDLRGTGARIVQPSQPPKAATPAQAIRTVLDTVSAAGMPAVEAVGYRVVHPGAKIHDHLRITEAVLRDLEEAVDFAPLHDPAAIEIIRSGMAHFPSVAHYACFDTVFHQTMPEEAMTLPVPLTHREQGVRKYGFHGLSCESIVRQLRAHGDELPKRMVIAHLGSGCSVTALRNGQSIDTTMGLTPAGGIVMGTRPGDLDSGLLLYLLRRQPGSRDEAAASLEAMLNHHSGMVALSGLPNDVKAVRKAAADGNPHAALALKVFTRSVTKAVGGFCWLLGGLDALIFAGGIGEHDSQTRSEVLAGLESQGIFVNISLNEAPAQTTAAALRRISASDSKTAVCIIPAQEDLMIAVHVDRMARSGT